MSILRRALSPLAFPLRRYLDPRFRGVHEHIDVAVDHRLRPHVDRRTAELQGALGTQLATLRDELAALRGQLAQFESHVTADTQTAAEFAATFRRSTDRLTSELRTAWGWLAGGESHLADLLGRAAEGDHAAEEELGKLLRELQPGAADQVVAAFQGVQLPLGPGTSHFLNWSSGHTGPSAQAGLWFNPPVTVHHIDGTVRPGDVNERIVEIPWAMAVAGALPPGSRVLDFGATESTLSLSLASLGLQVIAADLRPYPLSHPRLEVLVGPIEQWEGPGQPLDAVFCISAIEHVGLGAYDESPTEGPLDRAIVERFAAWLRPGGQLALTVPYGCWHVDELQRVYDTAHLDALLEGWEIRQRAICVQTAPNRWERVDGEPHPSVWEGGARGVALVLATHA